MRPLSSTASELTTTVTITDNDNGVSISDAATAKPVTEGTPTVKIPFEIEEAVNEIVTVMFSTADSTTGVSATEDQDYPALGTENTAQIPANERSGEFEIDITDDELDEPVETFIVTITGAQNESGVAIPISTGANSTEVKITDNDNGVSITNADTPIIVPEGDDDVEILFEIESALTEVLTVTFSTSDGTTGVTATADDDFIALSDIADNNTATIAVGDTKGTFDITIKEDATVESEENFTVTIISASTPNIASFPVSTGNGSTQVKITDNDAPEVSIVDANDGIDEVEGAGTVSIPLKLDRAISEPVTVTFEIVTGGTAEAGKDYTALTPGSNDAAIIAANTITGTFSVDLLDDSIFEQDETFTVRITEVSIPSQAPVGISADEREVVVTINDDDLPKISFDETAVTEAEGTADKTLNLAFTVDDTPPGPFTIYYQTESTGTGEGHAVGSLDFRVPTIIDDSNFVTFDSGTSGTIPITIIADQVDEPNETFTVKLIRGVGVDLSSTAAELEAEVTITDEADDETVVSFAEATSTIAENDEAGKVVLEVSLSHANAVDVEVPFTIDTTNSTAVAGTDYTAPTTSPITIPAGEDSGMIEIDITDDNADEAVKTLIVMLGTASGGGATTSATEADITHTVTINDNDGIVSIMDDTTPGIEVAEGVSGNVVEVPIEIDSADTTGDVVVTFEVVDDDETSTAIPGTDFIVPTGGSNTATIAMGSTSSVTGGHIQVTITDDMIDEEDETFIIRILSSPTASISDTANEIVVTITDNDDAPVIDLSTVVTAPNTEGTATEIQVEIFTDPTAATPITTMSSSREIEVHYMITDSTKADFIADENEISSISIPPGRTEAVKSIGIQENTVDQDGSDITIALLDDSGTILYTKISN